MVPFIRECNGRKLDTINDFRVPGVTSISCDPHKYGNSPKGVSVVMFRSDFLRRFHFFTQPNWHGGPFATTMTHDYRNGVPVIGAWITLCRNGRKGFREMCQENMETIQMVQNGIKEIPEVDLLGNSIVSGVAIVSKDQKKLNIYDVKDVMESLGWHLNANQLPPAIHLTVTTNSVDAIRKHFLNDFKASIKAVFFALSVLIGSRRVIQPNRSKKEAKWP